LDGNFQMNKLKTRNQSDDVALADGHGFMVKEEDYQSHIKIAIDHREVSAFCRL
jgi:hypothetical protein